MHISLQGKSVLITSSAAGIGRAIAVALAQAGAEIFIHHHGQRPAAQETLSCIAAIGGRAAIVEADTTQSAEVNEMVKTCTAAGKVDILVNNAGITLDKSVHDSGRPDWHHVLDMDLKSAFLCSHAILPHMLTHEHGCIINITLEPGYLGVTDTVPHTASNGTITTLTRSLAHDFFPNIRINAIALGPACGYAAPEEAWPMLMGDGSLAGKETALKQEEIVRTVLFLASNYSYFYTGQTLGPNSGAFMSQGHEIT